MADTCAVVVRIGNVSLFRCACRGARKFDGRFNTQIIIYTFIGKSFSTRTLFFVKRMYFQRGSLKSRSVWFGKMMNVAKVCVWRPSGCSVESGRRLFRITRVHGRSTYTSQCEVFPWFWFRRRTNQTSYDVLGEVLVIPSTRVRERDETSYVWSVAFLTFVVVNGVGLFD